MDFVYTLTYSVEMDLGVHPLGYFTGAQLTSDTSITSLPASATFTSEYYSSAAMDAGSLLGQVQSLNSGGSLVTPVVYGLRKVWIRDTYVATGNAIVNSSTDYLYLTVPEPSALALFGVGLAGLAARRRLHTKARA